MKAQTRSDEPNQRWLRADLQTCEIAGALKVVGLLMAPHSQGHSEKIEHATITRGERGNLRIRVSNVKLASMRAGSSIIRFSSQRSYAARYSQ